MHKPKVGKLCFLKTKTSKQICASSCPVTYGNKIQSLEKPVNMMPFCTLSCIDYIHLYNSLICIVPLTYSSLLTRRQCFFRRDGSRREALDPFSSVTSTFAVHHEVNTGLPRCCFCYDTLTSHW